MTNTKTAIKLLGLLAIMVLLPVIQPAFAVITNASGVTVTAPAQPNVNSVNVSWTTASTDDEPTDGALTGHYVEISNNGFTSVLQSVFISAPTTSTSFSSLQAGTSYDVRVIANFATAGNQTAVTGSGSTNTDVNNPVVTGSTTNINDGGSTTKTLTDQYTESCSAIDNDVFFNGVCSVQSGSIDTSVLGLQSVTYQATDPSSNTGTDVVSTTIVTGGIPVITLTGANPQVLVLNQAYTELGATASDAEDGNITGSIVIDSSAVNVNAVGSYIVTYDVTDSSGNTDHEERTVNVILGNAPVITITGDVGIFLPYGYPQYNDEGATCTDIEDGVIVVVTTGANLVNTQVPNTYQITYTCTDSSGNVDTEFRSVTVGSASTGKSCRGDCESPTIGLTKSGYRAVEKGLTVQTGSTKFVADAVPFFTPMELLHADVGQVVKVKTKIYDNSGKNNIIHAELGIGAKEVGDKNANARIEVDRSFDGVTSVKIIDPNSILTNVETGKVYADADWSETNCKESQPNAKDCALVTYTFTVQSPIKGYVLVTDVWDSYRYSQVTFFNHGIAFEGDSLNPLPEHYAMSAQKRIVQITEDEYMGDTAHDASGNKYVLQNNLWIPIINAPVKDLYVTSHGVERNSGYMQAYKNGQVEIAKTHKEYGFDSSLIQGELKESFTYDLPDRLPRGTSTIKSNASVCNMVLDMIASNPDVVNNSSCRLE